MLRRVSHSQSSVYPDAAEAVLSRHILCSISSKSSTGKSFTRILISSSNSNERSSNAKRPLESGSLLIFSRMNHISSVAPWICIWGEELANSFIKRNISDLISSFCTNSAICSYSPISMGLKYSRIVRTSSSNFLFRAGEMLPL